MTAKHFITSGLAALAVAITLGLWLLCGHADFEIAPPPRITDHIVPAGANQLAGTLVLPTDIATPPIALIVHGDGPQDRWSADTYLPLVNTLLDAGIGVFSWDKPGIGQSTGHWLDQSMADRTAEATAALAYLRDNQGIAPKRLGYLGFSQAGWVMPTARVQADAAFTVLIGPAINWRIQGAYYTAKRLQQQGLPPLQIDQRVAAELAQNDRIFAGDRTRPANMPQDRFAFVRKNYDVDATADIAAMTTPTLVLLGADDLNVNPVNSARIYLGHLPENPAHQVQIIPNATHGLLRSGPYNYQLPSEWSGLSQLRFLAAGRRAFAPGALDLLTTWILAQTGGAPG